MNQEEKSELFDKKSKREYDKMRMDMEHDVEQRHHWKVQRFIWICGVIVAVLALVLNTYAKTKGF